MLGVEGGGAQVDAPRRRTLMQPTGWISVFLKKMRIVKLPTTRSWRQIWYQRRKPRIGEEAVVKLSALLTQVGVIVGGLLKKKGLIYKRITSLQPYATLPSSSFLKCTSLSIYQSQTPYQLHQCRDISAVPLSYIIENKKVLAIDKNQQHYT